MWVLKGFLVVTGVRREGRDSFPRGLMTWGESAAALPCHVFIFMFKTFQLHIQTKPTISSLFWARSCVISKHLEQQLAEECPHMFMQREAFNTARALIRNWIQSYVLLKLLMDDHGSTLTTRKLPFRYICLE